jgi:hypothetical protein
MGEGSEIDDTPASESPTAADAPLAGAPLNPEDTLPALPSADKTPEDPLAALKQRPHPFA